MGASDNEGFPLVIRDAPIMNCPDRHELSFAHELHLRRMNCLTALKRRAIQITERDAREIMKP